MPLSDIRKFMPQTPQTDPDNFPAYVYRPYPRMMSRMVNGKPTPYYNPDGTPVAVQNETEEAQFKVKHGQVIDMPTAKSVEIGLSDIAAPTAPKRGRPPKVAHVVTKLPDDLT